MPRIYLAQFKPILLNKTKNLNIMYQFIREANKQKAEVILFPELALTGYHIRGKTAELAETKDGLSIRQLAKWAKEFQLKIVAGFPEKKEDGLFNSACFINDDGSLIGTYQKVHLWDEEPKYFQAGNDFPVFTTDIGKIGIIICYDTEFPETSRIMALKGADIILAPTANMTPLEHFQKISVQMRAAENQLFFATTNRIGIEEGTNFFGESAAADPYGNLLTIFENTEKGEVVKMDLNKINEVRSKFDYLADRKPSVYHSLIQEK